MKCQKLHQEIGELESKYREVELRYEEAERDGKGKKLKSAISDYDEVVDELLEKYLPDFQEQFGGKLGVKEAHIEGEIKGLGDRIISSSWGDIFAITDEGLFLVVENESGELSRGELIVAGKYPFGVFPMSSGEIMLPSDSEISVIKKVDGGYSLRGSISPRETIFASGHGFIYEIAAIFDRDWIISTTNGLYMLSYDDNKGLSFGKKIDLVGIDKYWDCPGPFLPLSDKEMLISDYNGGAGIFAKNDSGELTYVMNLFEIQNRNSDRVDEVVQITDDKWLLWNNYKRESRFLSRDGSSSQLHYEVSGPIHEMVAMSVRHVSYLSNNDFLIENSDGEVFVYTMQPDGSLKETSKITGSTWSFHIKNVLPLSDGVWLVNKHVEVSSLPIERQLGMSYILQRQENGKYELGEWLRGVYYVVQGTICLPSGKYLLSDQIYDSLKKDELSPKHYGLSILNICHIFKDVEDLKSRLGDIIEVGKT